MNLEACLYTLVRYGVEHHLVEEEDATYVFNQLFSYLNLGEMKPVKEVVSFTSLEQLLDSIIHQALLLHRLDPNFPNDYYQSKLMNLLCDKPSVLRKRFLQLYQSSPKEATDWWYHYAIDSNYIRYERTQKNLSWSYQGTNIELLITINLSKPEKDPRLITLASKSMSHSYPSCVLCIENEGYAGTSNMDSRDNLRLIPLTLAGEPWYLQYSPYQYYPEHIIVIAQNHTMMKIEPLTFVRLFDFLKQFPHYFIGSNAGLPVVGGSILNHNHFQGGNASFPIEKARKVKSFLHPQFNELSVSILDWPLSTIRLSDCDCNVLIEAASKLLTAWERYENKDFGILRETNGEKHNALTPIARMIGDCYELDLVLRNNRSSEQYPLGIFHPHPEIHHIKKENIGLIEVMGLAILPGRLQAELDLVRRYFEGDPRVDEGALGVHLEWAKLLLPKAKCLRREELGEFIHQEVAKVFHQGLKDCGVFPQTQEGRAALIGFLKDQGYEMC